MVAHGWRRDTSLTVDHLRCIVRSLRVSKASASLGEIASLSSLLFILDAATLLENLINGVNQSCLVVFESQINQILVQSSLFELFPLSAPTEKPPLKPFTFEKRLLTSLPVRLRKHLDCLWPTSCEASQGRD